MGKGRWGSGAGRMNVTGLIDDSNFDFSDGMTRLWGEVKGDKIAGEVSQEGVGGGKFSIIRDTYPKLYKGSFSHPASEDQSIKFEFELESTTTGRWNSGAGKMNVTGVIDNSNFDFSDGTTRFWGEVKGDKIAGEVSKEGVGGGKFAITRQ